jgi:hypothetical protein
VGGSGGREIIGGDRDTGAPPDHASSVDGSSLDGSTPASPDGADIRASEASPLIDARDAPLDVTPDTVEAGAWIRHMLVKNVIVAKVLDVAGDHVSNDQEIMIWPANNSPSQVWDLVPIGATADGRTTFHVVNQNSYRCMEVAAGDPTAGKHVTQHDCDRALSHQWWAMTGSPSMTFVLQNARTQLCLDLENVVGNDGTRAVQAQCDGRVSQQWSLAAAK